MICTLGDLLLDIVVRLEAQIAQDTDTYGRTKVGAGGQAANVAAWVVALGGESCFIGKRARDPAGRLVADELQSRGVELAGPVVDSGTGTVVSIATPDGQRTMLSDRGVAPELGEDEVNQAWFDSCERLHLPTYSLVAPPIQGAAILAAEYASRVSVDLSSTAALERAGVEQMRGVLAELAPDIVFANEVEAELVGSLDVETLVVKRGARGCVVRTGGGERDYPAHPAEVVDTTGAGDALAAGFLVGGPELGLEAAARCVAQLGAMP